MHTYIHTYMYIRTYVHTYVHTAPMDVLLMYVFTYVLLPWK